MANYINKVLKHDTRNVGRNQNFDEFISDHIRMKLHCYDETPFIL